MAKSKAGPLGMNEGRPVVATGLIIRKTGDGLNEAMQVEPRVLAHGEHVYVVLECDVVDIHYPVEDRKEPTVGGVTRVHVLDAGTATFIDGDVVRDAIAAQREKNERFREQQQGVQRIDDAFLVADHEDGQHIGDLFPVKYCAKCDEEVIAIEADTRVE